MMEPQYVATVKIEKVTETNRTVGFSTEKAEPARVEVASIKVSSGDLSNLKGKVASHLNIVEE